MPFLSTRCCCCTFHGTFRQVRVRHTYAQAALAIVPHSMIPLARSQRPHLLDVAHQALLTGRPGRPAQRRSSFHAMVPTAPPSQPPPTAPEGDAEMALQLQQDEQMRPQEPDAELDIEDAELDIEAFNDRYQRAAERSIRAQQTRARRATQKREREKHHAQEEEDTVACLCQAIGLLTDPHADVMSRLRVFTIQAASLSIMTRRKQGRAIMSTITGDALRAVDCSRISAAVVRYGASAEAALRALLVAYGICDGPATRQMQDMHVLLTANGMHSMDSS